MRVLIIEDQRSSREALSDLLELDGYEVDAAATYAEGESLALEQQHDFYLIDVHLPDGDGKNLVGVIRQRRPTAKIYLATGSARLLEENVNEFSFEDFHKLAVSLGADGYISKPIRYEQLIETLGG